MSTINREDAIAELMKMPKPLVHWEQVKKMLEAMPDVPDTNVGDMISRQAAIDYCYALINAENPSDPSDEWNYSQERIDQTEVILHHLEFMPAVQPEQRWIPIKWHDCTDEDREKYGFSNDIVAVFDCEMPDDDQPILVTTSHGYVNQDVCYIDDGFSLDSGWDWLDDIKAWMPLPKPYEERKE